MTAVPPWVAKNVTAIDKAAPPAVPGSPLDYALRYAAIGWNVFPVWGAEGGKCRCGRCDDDAKSPGKHPVEHLARGGVNSATTNPDQIRAWWTQFPEAGIGVSMAGSGLVAIDIDPRNGGLDTIDQIEAQHGPLVSDVLAFTQGGGEHRVFSLSSEAGLPGKLGNGIDIKRNGYIVVEPTHGVLGDYAWEASSDPLDGAVPSPLPDWMRGLSQAREPIAAEPVRFATREQIEELRSALSVLDSDDRDTWVRFLHALKPLGQDGWDLWDEWSRKSAKYDPVDSMRKWHSAKPAGAINYETIFFAAQAAGWVNPLAGGLPAPQPVASVRMAKPVTPVPAAQTQLPGVLGAVQDWINATSRKPQPLFATQAALAFGATILGRRYVTTRRNWPSLFFLNIGKSASGKEHAKWAIEQLIDACELGTRLVGPDGYTSDSGVLSALYSRPSHVTIIDEFGKVLEGAASRQNARVQGAFKTMMEAFGRADGVLRPLGYSTALMTQRDIEALEARVVRNPALTLLGMTTPETFYSAITSTAVRDGFLNRLLIVESDIGRQVGQNAPRLNVPVEITEWAARVREYDGLDDPDLNAGMTPSARVIDFDAQASALFGAFDAECIRRMDELDETGMAEMFGRSNEIAMRIALVLCMSEEAGVIRASHARVAIDYVRSNALRTIERLQVHLADSQVEAARNQVLEIIRQSGERGSTEREIHKRSRKFRALDHGSQQGLLKSFGMIGDAERVEMAGQSGRGRKRVAWVAVAEDENG